MAYRHGLVALDVHDNNSVLLHRAAELNAQGVVLDVMSVLDSFDLYYQLEPSLGRMSKKFEEEVLARTRAALVKAVASLNLDEANIHLVQGHKARSIVDFAQANACDLIVMGSHGRHGIDRLLGATSYAVLHHAPCDVLTVPVGTDDRGKSRAQ